MVTLYEFEHECYEGGTEFDLGARHTRRELYIKGKGAILFSEVPAYLSEKERTKREGAVGFTKSEEPLKIMEGIIAGNKIRGIVYMGTREVADDVVNKLIAQGETANVARKAFFESGKNLASILDGSSATLPTL
jgi:hypothetical protein